MIILSGVLVVLAIALLVTGIVTGNTGHEVAGLDGLKLIYVSIGISIISALCLAIGVFLRRKELFGSANAETSAKKSAARSKTARPAKAKARVGAGEEAPVAVAPTTAVDVPAETSVYVVPGRKRYHLETCRQLAGRDKEELTYVEAREEGFTACTACLPDTALAARAAVTEAESTAETPAPADDTRTTESLETVAETAELTRPRDDDPAPVTRTDLPVTRLDDDETAPAAESPAEAELTETPEADAPHETDAKAQPEVDETPAEPAAERPQARSRSFFEPLDRGDATTTDETPAEDDAAPSEEPAEPEDTVAEPEDAEPTPTRSEAAEEPEAVEDSETAEQPSGTEDEPAAEASVDEDPAETDVAETDHSDEADETETDEPAEEAAEADGSATDHEDEPEQPAADAESADADADADTDASSDDSLVRILSGTKRYHRPTCALIEDIADDADDLESLPRAEAKERGCTPCLVCQPDKDSSDD
ncbi:hypothetical protein GCM10023191_049890 [Actinoallomurus oryzae]|uniref:Uncharacterized protein n=1 Tax=Actinoallomurus oryzae TaxID=502180 RepID=A0ABP8QCC9_9ACTN